MFSCVMQERIVRLFRFESHLAKEDFLNIHADQKQVTRWVAITVNLTKRNTFEFSSSE